jgi:hypothetical protein
MVNEEPAKPQAPQSHPVTLLEKQVQLLSALYQLQLKQQERLDALQAGQTAHAERMATLAESVKGWADRTDGVPRHVEIRDLNMPFISLVGFIVKAWLASIPAALIIGLVAFLVFLVAGGFSAIPFLR